MTELGYRAKGALQEYRQLSKRISEKRERLRALMDSATRATPSLEAERISGTSEHSRLESAVIRKVDLENQLSNSILELDRKRHAIQSAVDAMLDAREARLLEMRYIDGRSWASVNTRLEIGETWSRVIHESALQHFAEIFFN